MRKVAIISTGHTDFGFNSPKTELGLFCEAATEAMGTALAALSFIKNRQNNP